MGTGHGFPAFQANLFIEGSLNKNLTDIISNFSTPYGYPSHLNPEAPGVILEGGELGYSLSVAGGSVLDSPKLINVCLVGDGEAETGALSASWNINRFINPKSDGVVLPVLHLNGYKISGPTIFGRMGDEEISDFFRSHGYTPLFADRDKFEKYDEFISHVIGVFDKAMDIIGALKNQANSNIGLMSPRWPVIVLKTPKGMGAPEFVNGVKVAGNYASHQVIFDKLHEDSEDGKTQLKQLEEWLRSYRVEDLIKNIDKVLSGDNPEYDDDIVANIPEGDRRVGGSPYAHGLLRGDLDFPKEDVLRSVIKQRGEKGEDTMKVAGKYMAELFALNAERRNFRLFSPDETYSNHIDAIFEKESRAWQWPIYEHDKDLSQDGRIVELLSEHVLFGMLIGYTMSGKYGFFVSYEAFASIVSSMVEQYIKFVSVARKVSFRKPLSPLNIILSSLLERQDHNGFSHQNPSFVASVLNHNSDIVNVYFPADKNVMLEVMDLSLMSDNSVNVIVAGKNVKRTWLSPQEARQQAQDGIMIWDFLSNPGEPDLVMVTCGDYVTEEAVIGVTLFRKRFPHVKIRFVNVCKLDVFSEYASHEYEGFDTKGKNSFKHELVDKFFTESKPIVFNFHGYTATIRQLLFGYNVSDRIIINGYQERGSTTSPFDMLARNRLSRFHLVSDLALQAGRAGMIEESQVQEVLQEMEDKLNWEKEYIITHKVDPPEISEW